MIFTPRGRRDSSNKLDVSTNYISVQCSRTLRTDFTKSTKLKSCIRETPASNRGSDKSYFFFPEVLHHFSQFLQVNFQRITKINPQSLHFEIILIFSFIILFYLETLCRQIVISQLYQPKMKEETTKYYVSVHTSVAQSFFFLR